MGILLKSFVRQTRPFKQFGDVADTDSHSNKLCSISLQTDYSSTEGRGTSFAHSCMSHGIFALNDYLYKYCRVAFCISFFYCLCCTF